MTGKLTARRVAGFKAPGKLGDGGGLWLRATRGGGRWWFLRYRFRGRNRELGLGSPDEVGLKEARQDAVWARRQIHEGIDPIEQRRNERAKSSAPTFAECAERFISANQAAWRNAKHCAQWRSTLKTYAYPVFEATPVDAIDVADVLKVLKPLWTLKPETASRLRGRIERVLDWARVSEYRQGENPARWHGHLDQLLPKPSDVRAVRHHAALAWREIPQFMGDLRQRQGVAARALEFAILTAARSGEVRAMQWAEMDADKTWTVPAERMKAKRKHRVPLSPRAGAVLDEMRRFGCEPGQLVFPGMRPGKPLSDMTLSAVLKRMGRHDSTVHGFRSSFRDWCAEATNFPREVCEEALAHTLASKVEAAYRRGDLFEKRRPLMAAWAVYCGQSAVGADVVPIRG